MKGGCEDTLQASSNHARTVVAKELEHAVSDHAGKQSGAQLIRAGSSELHCIRQFFGRLDTMLPIGTFLLRVQDVDQ